MIQLSVARAYLDGTNLGFDLQRRLDLNTVVGWVGPRWPALQPGDVLRTMNGQPVNANTFFHRRLSYPVGPIEIEIERDGARLSLAGSVEKNTLSVALPIIVRWLAGAILFLLGIAVFLLKPGTRPSWILALSSICGGTVVMVTPDAPLPITLVLLGLHTTFALTPVTMIHLFSIFPSPMPYERKVPLLYIAAAVILVMHVLATLVLKWAPLINAGELIVRIFGVTMSLLGTAGIVAQWVSARRRKDERSESAARPVVIATALGVLVPMTAATMVHTFKLDGGLVQQIAPMFVIFFSVTLALVFVRYNPMEIDRYTASVAGYVATIGGLGSLALFAVVSVPRLMSSLGVASDTEVIAVVSALTVVSFGPVYRRIRKRIDSLFSASNADALQTAEVLRRTAESVQGRSRDEVLRNIVSDCLVLGGDYAALWTVDASGTALVRSAAAGQHDEAAPISRDSPVAEAMNRSGGVRTLSVTTLSPAAQEGLWSLGFAMSAPVRAHGVPVGFVAVSRRTSGFGYRAEDQSFLEAMAAQAGLAMERGEVVTQIGRYRVEKRLAAGGMAEVFVGWQIGPGGFERKVALKRLLPELAEDPRSAASLLDEARISAQLQHRNVAQVFEVGLEAGQHFIVMEFVDGPPLRAMIAAQVRTGAKTPIPIFLTIARSLLSALEHAHSLTDPNGVLLNVVHRDVTPANVLVSKNGDVKLVDFGLVLATERLYRTKTGVARGTLPYMSQEQVMQSPMDRRADVYSAAATLYELLVGTRAFPEGPLSGTYVKAPSQIRREVPAEADAVFFKALSLSRDDRFATTDAFWEALSAACQTHPRASEAEVGKWVKENLEASAQASQNAEPTAAMATVNPGS